MVLILNSTIVFVNPIRKIPVLDRLAHETLKYFVLNKTRYIEVFKGANSEFDNFFFIFTLKTLFWRKIGSEIQNFFDLKFFDFSV